MTAGFRDAPPPPPLPDGLAVERFAVAMAAATGIVWRDADEEQVGLYRRAAHAVLVVFGADAPGLGGGYLAATLDEARTCLRYAAAKIEGPDASEGDEAWIVRLYRCATAMEGGAQALEAIAEPEAETEEMI